MILTWSERILHCLIAECNCSIECLLYEKKIMILKKITCYNYKDSLKPEYLIIECFFTSSHWPQGSYHCSMISLQRIVISICYTLHGGCLKFLCLLCKSTMFKLTKSQVLSKWIKGITVNLQNHWLPIFIIPSTIRTFKSGWRIVQQWETTSNR